MCSEGRWQLSAPSRLVGRRVHAKTKACNLVLCTPGVAAPRARAPDVTAVQRRVLQAIHTRDVCVRLGTPAPGREWKREIGGKGVAGRELAARA